MSFTSQIGYLTGNPSANDATLIANALTDGVKEVISKVAQINPNLLHSMSTEVEVTSNTDTDNQLSENNIVLAVTRYDSVNSITRNCIPIDKKNIEKATDTGSIYYAPITSPVYAQNNGKVLIFPEPSATNKGHVTKVVSGTVSDGTNSILNMPSNLHQQVVRFAARECLLYRIGTFTTQLPTDLDDTTVFDAITDADVELPALSKSLPANFTLTATMPTYSAIGFPSAEVGDALTKAQKLIDDAANIDGDESIGSADIYSAQKWLIDEDPEMLNGTLQTAAQELQRANGIVAEHNAQISSGTAEYNNAMAKFQADVAREAQQTNTDLSEYQAELAKNVAFQNQKLQEYTTNLGKKMTSFTTLISKLTTDYQWMVQQLQVVTQQLAEGWSAIAIPDIDSQAKALGGGIGK